MNGQEEKGHGGFHKMIILRIHPDIKESAQEIIGLKPFILNKDRVQIMQDPSIMVYKRSNVLPDTRFFKWLSDAQIQNPPSWAIFFGLVEKVPYYKFIERDRATISTPDGPVSF